MTVRRRTGLLLGASVLALTMLSGCAAPRTVAAHGTDAWNGRLALRVDSDPPQSYSAGFDLQGSAQAGQLLLATPLGTTLATLAWKPGWAEWTQRGQTTQNDSLQAITADLGGAALPVVALFAWLQGQNTPVDGWEVDLSHHAEGRIVARRTAPPPAAELRLVFSR